jgi:hypothetical protein
LQNSGHDCGIPEWKRGSKENQTVEGWNSAIPKKSAETNNRQWDVNWEFRIEVQRESREATHGRPDFWNSGLKRGSKASRDRGPNSAIPKLKRSSKD